MRNNDMNPDTNKNGIFSSDKPKNIPKFWYPLTLNVIITWVIFSLIVVKQAKYGG